MIDKLQTYLATIPPGPISDARTLTRLLAAAWGEFSGNDGGLIAQKHLSRMEDVAWNPPLLTFTIERHGGTVLGSTRAKLQEWSVDVEKRTTSLVEKRHRQVRPMQARLDVEATAEEIAGLIVTGKEDDRLQWYKDGRVRVLVGKVLPEGSAAKQTLAGRRRRFRAALTERLERECWGLGQFWHIYRLSR